MLLQTYHIYMLIWGMPDLVVVNVSSAHFLDSQNYNASDHHTSLVDEVGSRNFSHSVFALAL